MKHISFKYLVGLMCLVVVSSKAFTVRGRAIPAFIYFALANAQKDSDQCLLQLASAEPHGLRMLLPNGGPEEA